MSLLHTPLKDLSAISLILLHYNVAGRMQVLYAFLLCLYI